MVKQVKTRTLLKTSSLAWVEIRTVEAINFTRNRISLLKFFYFLLYFLNNIYSGMPRVVKYCRLESSRILFLSIGKPEV